MVIPEMHRIGIRNGKSAWRLKSRDYFQPGIAVAKGV